MYYLMYYLIGARSKIYESLYLGIGGWGMRETKFRAIPKRDGYETFFFTLEDQGGWRPEDAVFESDCHISQFTGLKDKNGKEIYEGDLVRMDRIKHPYMNGVWRIVFRHGCFTIGEDGMYFWDYGKGMNADDTIEAIGNIHENPDLLTTTTEGGE